MTQTPPAAEGLCHAQKAGTRMALPPALPPAGKPLQMQRVFLWFQLLSPHLGATLLKQSQEIAPRLNQAGWWKSDLLALRPVYPFWSTVSSLPRHPFSALFQAEENLQLNKRNYKAVLQHVSLYFQEDSSREKQLFLSFLLIPSKNDILILFLPFLRKKHRLIYILCERM